MIWAAVSTVESIFIATVYLSPQNSMDSLDKERLRGYNDVLDSEPVVSCNRDALQAMGDRLLDWFSVIQADAKRRRARNNKPRASEYNHTNSVSMIIDFRELKICTFLTGTEGLFGHPGEMSRILPYRNYSS